MFLVLLIPGLYNVVKYWQACGLSGFLVYKFALKRCDDQAPPPWELTDETETNTQSDNTETNGCSDSWLSWHVYRKYVQEILFSLRFNFTLIILLYWLSLLIFNHYSAVMLSKFLHFNSFLLKFKWQCNFFWWNKVFYLSYSWVVGQFALLTRNF